MEYRREYYELLIRVDQGGNIGQRRQQQHLSLLFQATGYDVVSRISRGGLKDTVSSNSIKVITHRIDGR